MRPLAPSLAALAVLGAALISLASCQSTRTNSNSQDPPVSWEQYGATLATLGRVSSRVIADPSSRIFALIRSAQAAAQTGQSALGLAALARATALTGTIESDLLRTELYTAVGRGYLRLDGADQGLEILTRATDILISRFAAEPDQEPRAIQVLEDLIYSLFELGTPGFDQLRRAVQRIYVVSDYGQRVVLLTRIAAQYQAQGSGQRANLLLQQAVAALDAIDDPVRRAVGYTAVARRFFVQDDLEDAQEYAQHGLAQIQQLPIQDFGTDTALQIQEALEDLIVLGYAAETTGLIQRLSSPEVRQNLLLNLAESYLHSGQAFAGELIIQQAIQIANGLDSVQSTVYAYLRIAEIFLSSGDPDSAAFYAETLYLNGRLSSEFLDDFALSEALSLLVRIGLRELADTVLAQIREPYLPLLSLDRTLQGEDLDPDLLSWVLARQRLLIERLETQIDEGRSRLAVGLSRAEQYYEALDVLGQIEDPYALSLAASEMAELTPLSLGSEYAEALTQIIRRFDGSSQASAPN